MALASSWAMASLAVRTSVDPGWTLPPPLPRDACAALHARLPERRCDRCLARTCPICSESSKFLLLCAACSAHKRAARLGA